MIPEYYKEILSANNDHKSLPFRKATNGRGWSDYQIEIEKRKQTNNNTVINDSLSKDTQMTALTTSYLKPTWHVCPNCHSAQCMCNIGSR